MASASIGPFEETVDFNAIRNGYLPDNWDPVKPGMLFPDNKLFSYMQGYMGDARSCCQVADIEGMEEALKMAEGYAILLGRDISYFRREIYWKYPERLSLEWAKAVTGVEAIISNDMASIKFKRREAEPLVRRVRELSQRISRTSKWNSFFWERKVHRKLAKAVDGVLYVH